MSTQTTPSHDPQDLSLRPSTSLACVFPTQLFSRERTYMATLLKLCPEDQEKYPGPEWLRFDEFDLDEQDLLTLNAYEVGLNCTLDFLFSVDKPAQSIRWTAARVWLARRMAGIDTPPLPEFAIKPRKVEVKEEPKAKARKAKAGDDDVPPSSAPSSEPAASGTASA